MSEHLNRAIYDTAHDFPGGVPALAKRMSTHTGTLFNKVSPTHEGHRLNIYEALAIQLITGDLRILHALAAELGQGCVTLGDFSDCSDNALLDLILRVGQARGETDAEIRRALADGRVERREYESIRCRVQEDIRANLEMLTRLDALAKADEEAQERKRLRAVSA
ncbi:phage regulatory CII family protein [Thiorhodococcus fuscus]|uniref:Phage regulatory CII family protein n=1 Tax=Thiorhodococcus fuscus TaxID=527200 RepID=A0ABW4Y783_9GAMM